MQKKELNSIYEELSVKRKSQLPKYLQILRTYFPYVDTDFKESAIKAHMDRYGLSREDAETLFEFSDLDVDDVRDPKYAYIVSKLFKNKQGVAKKAKEFIDNFITTLDGFGSLYHAYENNVLDRYLDSDTLYFNHEDIVITDPCYIIKDEDWVRCDFGRDLSIFGVQKYIVHDTLYGDWSCTVYNLDKNREPMGEFCADAAHVSVLSLKDISENINPDFEAWVKEHDWCATIIRDYIGIVQIKTGFNSAYNEFYAYVSGSGSINFVGEQTGF